MLPWSNWAWQWLYDEVDTDAWAGAWFGSFPEDPRASNVGSECTTRALANDTPRLTLASLLAIEAAEQTYSEGEQEDLYLRGLSPPAQYNEELQEVVYLDDGELQGEGQSDEAMSQCSAQSYDTGMSRCSTQSYSMGLSQHGTPAYNEKLQEEVYQGQALPAATRSIVQCDRPSTLTKAMMQHPVARTFSAPSLLTVGSFHLR